MAEVFSVQEIKNIADLIEAQLQDNREAINKAFENMGEFIASIAVKAVPRNGKVNVAVSSGWTTSKFKTQSKLSFNPAQLPMFPE